MTRVKKPKTRVRTSSILIIVLIFLLWAGVMTGVAWIMIPRLQEPGPNSSNSAVHDRAARLLADRTRERMEEAPLDKAGKITAFARKPGPLGDAYVLTFQTGSETDLIVAEKAIQDIWTDLAGLEIDIEYPDHAKTGERIRMFASVADRPAVVVLLGVKPAPPPDPAPIKPPTPAPPKPAHHTGKIVIIIDDIGYDLEALDKLLDLPAPITFAVLPYSPLVRVSAQNITARGKQVMLHMPMEPSNYPQDYPGEGALLLGMTPGDIRERVELALQAVPEASGMNNHMGSAFTADPAGMEPVLALLKERGMFFVDSRTSMDTIGYQLARNLGLAAAQRKVFLDHDIDPGRIRAKLFELAELADKEGFAVAIGHPHPETVQVLCEEIPAMVAQGYRFVFASEVAR